MEVLIHTYMDLLRNDDDREINHHGSSVKPVDSKDDIVKPNYSKDDDIVIAPVDISSSQTTLFVPRLKYVRPEDLISRHEDTQVEALKNHYQNLKNDEIKHKQRKLELVRKFLLIYYPVGALTFVFVAAQKQKQKVLQY